MAEASSPEQRAERLARLIVEEIILYNREKVKQGIESDTLFDVLARDILAGRRYYEANVGSDLAPQSNYFDQALVDILVRGEGSRIPSRIW
jgi:hypothetical protein